MCKKMDASCKHPGVTFFNGDARSNEKLFSRFTPLAPHGPYRKISFLRWLVLILINLRAFCCLSPAFHVNSDSEGRIDGASSSVPAEVS